MQVSAKANRLHISPQKARLVVDQVRGKPVSDAPLKAEDLIGSRPRFIMGK